MAIEDWRLMETLNELHQFLQRANGDASNMTKNSGELARVHEKGWRLTAEAIERGLKDIADAVRQRSR